MSSIFTLGYENNYLPVEWLRAYITPIFKKGSSTDPNNYRPIALTSTICKLMESIIKNQILSYLLTKGLISKKQHAFIANHSTATNLLECTQDWFVSLNSSRDTDVIYIDFSRAFDSIVISKLLFKLEQYGICGKLLNWISSFLTNRSQCVVLDHNYSTVCEVVSGVPQGSVLGPLLFIIFINDIETVCCGDCSLQLFADDVKLYSRIDLNHSSTLQQSLDNLVEWASAWQLSININKCTVLIVSNKSSISNRSYFINGICIDASTHVRDLGITISSNLSFQLHINNIVAKARQRVSALFRGFISRNLIIMRNAFICYIRPLLEYNSIVWNPSHIYLIELIENVQRNFTKRIASLSSMSYHERLAALNLEPLELRRLRFDLVNYYKIINNISPIDPSNIFSFSNTITSTRSALPHLLKPLKASNKLLSTFSCRQIDCWNYLPPLTRNLTSLTSFKSALKNIDFSSFLKSSAFRQ